MAEESSEPLRLLRCLKCEYDLSGLPAEYVCPECGFHYDLTMFDLPGSAGVGKYRPLVQRRWVDWVIRPLMYGVVPVAFIIVGIRLGVPAQVWLQLIMQAAFLVVSFVGVIMLFKLLNNRNPELFKKEPVIRTADSNHFTLHRDANMTFRHRWTVFARLKMVKLGEYPDTGEYRWHVKLVRNSRWRRFFPGNVKFWMVCNDQVADNIRQRITNLIDECGDRLNEGAKAPPTMPLRNGAAG